MYQISMDPTAEYFPAQGSSGHPFDASNAGGRPQEQSLYATQPNQYGFGLQNQFPGGQMIQHIPYSASVPVNSSQRQLYSHSPNPPTLTLAHSNFHPRQQAQPQPIPQHHQLQPGYHTQQHHNQLVNLSASLESQQSLNSIAVGSLLEHALSPTSSSFSPTTMDVPPWNYIDSNGNTPDIIPTPTQSNFPMPLPGSGAIAGSMSSHPMASVQANQGYLSQSLPTQISQMYITNPQSYQQTQSAHHQVIQQQIHPNQYNQPNTINQAPSQQQQSLDLKLLKPLDLPQFFPKRSYQDSFPDGSTSHANANRPSHGGSNPAIFNSSRQTLQNTSVQSRKRRKSELSKPQAAALAQSIDSLINRNILSNPLPTPPPTATIPNQSLSSGINEGQLQSPLTSNNMDLSPVLQNQTQQDQENVNSNSEESGHQEFPSIAVPATPPRAAQKQATASSAADGKVKAKMTEQEDLDKGDSTPREQSLRFPGDLYTPRLIRYEGQYREGYCGMCPEERWLQLKNSAYWYHMQYFHGICSTTGQPFYEPIEKRLRPVPVPPSAIGMTSEQTVLEGLCHQCKEWVVISGRKKNTNASLWYRHAHKCHQYQRPRGVGIKRRGSQCSGTGLVVDNSSGQQNENQNQQAPGQMDMRLAEDVALNQSKQHEAEQQSIASAVTLLEIASNAKLPNSEHYLQSHQSPALQLQSFIPLPPPDSSINSSAQGFPNEAIYYQAYPHIQHSQSNHGAPNFACVNNQLTEHGTGL